MWKLLIYIWNEDCPTRSSNCKCFEFKTEIAARAAGEHFNRGDCFWIIVQDE